MDIVGLIPAAGYARRLGAFPGAKEMISVKGRYGLEPVCHSLIRQFSNAGINQVVLITRREKTDLVHHLETNLDLNVEIKTCFVEKTDSTLESICSAYEFIKGKEVYLGFPDMIISPADAMSEFVKARCGLNSDVVLGAFPFDDAGKADMINFDANNRLIDIVIKDPKCRHKYAWIIACWNAGFTDYLFNYFQSNKLGNKTEEVYIGSIFEVYLKAGHSIDVHSVRGGKFVDIGTPEVLATL